MTPTLVHRWDLSIDEATNLQSELAQQVALEDRFDTIKTVAGVDVAYAKHTDTIVAGVAVLALDALQVLETKTAKATARFPYVPTLFSFRELPAIVDVLQALTITPDLIVCDGQGIAHPRRFGLASHLGVLFDVPTIGCAKSRLVGSTTEPAAARGSRTPIIDHGDVVGCTLRTQANSRPIFVSPGHRISVATACDWILRLAPGYRLPETTRLADQAVRRCLAR